MCVFGIFCCVVCFGFWNVGYDRVFKGVVVGVVSLR